MAKPQTTPVPLRPTQVLDPYPDYVTSASGVRQTTHPEAAPARPVFRVTPATAPTVFGASLQPLVTVRRRPLLPIASTVATIFGQAVLGALIATQTVDPALGALICIGWLTCGLAVIFAQCAALATRNNCPG